MKLSKRLVCFYVAVVAVYACLAQTPLYFSAGCAQPYAVDLDGNGRAELMLFDSATGALSFRKLGGDELVVNLLIAENGFAAAFADYDGDGLTDPTTYDHVSGMWYSFVSGQHYNLGVFQGAVGMETTVPVPADYDGNGRADPALYDPTLGVWVVYPSRMAYQPVAFQHMAGPGCVPVPADFDGDGRVDLVVYDEETGIWMACLSGSGYAAHTLVYGGPGYVPVPADFDGDGRADPAVYNAAMGGVWGVLYSSRNYEPSIVVQGGPGCVPVPGKYYFTNSADFAVYNPADGSWVIAYESPLVAVDPWWQNAASAVLPGLLTGNWKGAAAGGIGWGLKIFFDMFKAPDPEDPHWAEMRAILNEMNGKLDQLLTLSVEIKNQLNALCLQLAYDSEHIKILVSQLLANEAFASIGSVYDSRSPEGYQRFYNYDTNYPPSDQEVQIIANKILATDMPKQIVRIRLTMLPELQTERGVLRRWVDMAKMKGITPDNLLDHYQALFAYFSTLYSYQIKAGAMYVDACRQTWTNESQNAATYAWITNNFIKTLESEVNEFRGATYELVMTALQSAYNPLSASNQLVNVPNVNETLSVLEFFAQKWLGQRTTLCATFLTVDRPEIIKKYDDISCLQPGRPDPYFPIYPKIMPRANVVTNYGYGRPYGFKNPDINNIVVNDRYVFTRVVYPSAICGFVYKIYTSKETLANVGLYRYNDNMQQVSPSGGGNDFRHILLSPWNYETLTLPLNTPDWWHNRNENISYTGGQPGHTGIKYDLQSRVSGNGICMIMELDYDLQYFGKLPGHFGVNPWFFALGYPFAVSNQTARPLNAHAYMTIDGYGTYVSCQRWDSGNQSAYKTYQDNSQYYTFGGGGIMWFRHGAAAKWLEPSRRNKHSAGSERRSGWDSRMFPAYVLAEYTVPSRRNESLMLYIGGEMTLHQDCHRKWGIRDPFPKIWSAKCNAWGWVSFNPKQVKIDFR